MSVVIIFFLKVKNSQWWYFAWENLRGGFCCIFIPFLIFILLSFVDVLHFIFDHHFVVICWCSSFHFWSSFCSHLLMFFIHIFAFQRLPRPSADYRRGLHPILYFQPGAWQSDSGHFHFQPFRYLLTASATVLNGRFLPTGVFCLTLLHRRVIRDFTSPTLFTVSATDLREHFLLSGVFYLTLLIPKEAADFPRGDRHFNHVPPPTNLISLSPKELYTVGSI